MEFKDYLMLPVMIKIADFADKAEKAIRTHYKKSFGIGNPEITVYSSFHSENSCEATLSITGEWKWHDEWWGGRNYELMCSGEDIFKHFVKLIESAGNDNTMSCALFDFLYWMEKLLEMKDYDIEGLLKYLREISI